MGTGRCRQSHWSLCPWLQLLCMHLRKCQRCHNATFAFLDCWSSTRRTPEHVMSSMGRTSHGQVAAAYVLSEVERLSLWLHSFLEDRSQPTTNGWYAHRVEAGVAHLMMAWHRSESSTLRTNLGQSSHFLMQPQVYTVGLQPAAFGSCWLSEKLSLVAKSFQLHSQHIVLWRSCPSVHSWSYRLVSPFTEITFPDLETFCTLVIPVSSTFQIRDASKWFVVNSCLKYLKKSSNLYTIEVDCMCQTCWLQGSKWQFRFFWEIAVPNLCQSVSLWH